MLKSTVNIMFSIVILLSSTGFIVNMHFCQEHLIDIAGMAPAHSCCGDSVDEGSCCDMNIDSKLDHCKDESISVETSGVYLSSIFSYNFEDTSPSIFYFLTGIL